MLTSQPGHMCTEDSTDITATAHAHGAPNVVRQSEAIACVCSGQCLLVTVLWHTFTIILLSFRPCDMNGSRLYPQV